MAWTLVLVAGCDITPPVLPPVRTAEMGPNTGMIELAAYEPQDVIDDPAGGDAPIVGGRIIVDFDNMLDLAIIDAVLAAHNLARIGIVGAINLVTAEILDDRTEMQAGADIEENPNHYIRRRRLQQYGPRLDKPYNFYSWVAQARKAIQERGQVPIQLSAEPMGSELARIAHRPY